MTPLPHKPSPRVALARWLAQLHYNNIRNIETAFGHITRTDAPPAQKKVLRGFKLSEDLVITRKRTFYRIMGLQAVPVSIEEVAANYNLEALRERYRAAADAWKYEQRNRRRRA